MNSIPLNVNCRLWLLNDGKREIRVIYRYARPDNCVKGTIVHAKLWDKVVVRLDNGVEITRHHKSFDITSIKQPNIEGVAVFKDYAKLVCHFYNNPEL